ncbi:MAG: GNAT family N-acetyltransferase [Eubacteriales bacterium]|nr:GNAT family N-acetyltransferase [Eubacteriales bacterium]
MTIRNMTIADYEDIYQLWIHTPGMGLNTTDDSRAGIEAYLRRNPNTCFVAQEDGACIGAILAGHDGRRGFIYHLTVAMEHRGKKIGSKLVKEAMAALKREGIHKVALVVFDKNEAGNAFWEKLGFGKREDLIYRNKSITELVRIDT